MQKLLQDINIGHNLKRLRKQKNCSQNDIATMMELKGRSMSRANYAHIEQGTRNIYISDLILLKEFYNVNYDEFFKDLSYELKSTTKANKPLK